ncbi:response regulator [Desulfosarcina sp. OttesenSCG-928-A07]|nr:response regulator [Desulfosarcina sp. OttesenSCG-928-A07]
MSPFKEDALAEIQTVKIGVLAIRGKEQSKTQWSPTADYLSSQIPGYRFVIEPLSHNEIYVAAKQEAVDFIFSNSAFYVGLEYWFHCNRIATVKERRGNGIYTRYGGVIFCRKDRTDIRTLADVKGKTFMAVSPISLGGWFMAFREFRENGIDPFRDFTRVDFGETHDKVVYDVLNRRVDVGTVRTNTLENLAAEEKINLDDFYVFPPLHPDNTPTPYLCTTREYPNWPMAKVRHTSDELAEKVAIALLQMPPDSPAAISAACAGWTIPLNYQSVHDCLRYLQDGPYKDIGEITLKDVLRTYGYWIFFVSVAFFTLVLFTIAILKLNRRISVSNIRLQVEMELRKNRDRELEAAKEMAEAATRAKSDFLANMSHEIRTPMNGVIVAVDLALGEKLPPKVEDYLDIIQSSAYSLLGIINDILDFSKIEAGKFDLKERVFQLPAVFDRVMEIFMNRAAEKGIELLLDISPGIPKILIGDPLRLQQILTNLVSNAIKFTTAGGVILMRVKPGEPDPQSDDPEVVPLDFSVKDTGSGISPEYMNMLFEPFTQADMSSTRKHEGTGLGLSICKQLTRLMNGDIWVESEPGKGSTFYFTVKLTRSDAVTTRPPVIPDDIKELTILVVDDVADSRRIVKSILESLDINVELADSGQAALDRLQAPSPQDPPVDLILMDWRMPDMDGIETSKKIRQELQLATPIIMMTAFGKETQRIEAEQAGINGFLTKPIYQTTLLDAIMEGLGKQGQKDAPRKKHFTTQASIYRNALKGLHVLLAEDNLTNQQVARATLEKAGITVTVVENGEEAVEAVRNNRFDAVLMDIQMPKMNGYEATQWIRQLPHGATLPIVAMTAYAMKEDEERALEAGMDGYVPKPINRDQLFHCLWRLLGNRRKVGEKGVEAEASATGPGEQPALEATAETDPEDNFKRPEDSENEPHGGDDHFPEAHDLIPDTLPGLDIADTMAVLGLDAPTFARILTGFGDNNQNTMDMLRRAAAEKDTRTLHQLAHSLKGSAANMGAVKLSQVAYTLEMLCHTDRPDDIDPAEVDVCLTHVETALNQVLESIGTVSRLLMSEKTTAPTDTAQAENRLDTLLTELADAIDKSDPEAVSTHMTAVIRTARQCSCQSHSLFHHLETQIRRYDYDQALETIQTIKKYRGQQ